MFSNKFISQAAVRCGVKLFNALRIDNPQWHPNLRDANLRGADLRGANLRGTNLYDANLRDADLRDADLPGADLRGADLYGADLPGADLCGADLYDADLRGADLRGADLYGTNLYQANTATNPEFIHAGADGAGNQLFARVNPNESLTIYGGCRTWHSFTEARNHYKEPYVGSANPKEALLMLDHLETMFDFRQHDQK